MDISDKKILYITLSPELFEQMKNGVVKSKRLEYNKYWKDKLMYPCGTFKKYDSVLFQDEAQTKGSQILAELSEVNIIKERKNWIKTKKYFEIRFGNIVDEKD